MKLLRLTTNDNNAVFNNTINEDIKIEPGSRIALKNFSCKINPSKFFIDSTNNKIIFSADGAGKIKEFRLTPGTLDINTYSQYLIELEDSINSRLEYSESTVGALQNDRGMQARVDVIDEKVEIELRKGQEERANDSGKYNSFNISNTAAYLLNRISGRGDLGSFAWWELPIAKGSGRFGMRLGNLSAAGGTEGVYIGLVRQLPTSSTTTFNLNDMVIGIYAERAGADYKYVINGVETTSSGDTVNIISNNNTNNDFLEIYISEGKLIASVSQFDGTTVDEIFLQNLDYNNRDDLFPVVVFRGNNTTDNCRIGTPRIIVDPFKFPVLNSPDPGSLGSTIPSYTPTSPTQVFFEFDDPELARFLGFQNNRQPGTGFSFTDVNSPFLFQGTNQFAPSDLSESYLIELLNIKINSFDALINQRSNTLCTIVSDISNLSNNLISYEAQFPVFIDVNNETTINLRNIRARILKEDRGQIVINGFAQMTLLITSPSDTFAGRI